MAENNTLCPPLFSDISVHSEARRPEVRRPTRVSLGSSPSVSWAGSFWRLREPCFLPFSSFQRPPTSLVRGPSASPKPAGWPLQSPSDSSPLPLRGPYGDSGPTRSSRTTAPSPGPRPCHTGKAPLAMKGSSSRIPSEHENTDIVGGALPRLPQVPSLLNLLRFWARERSLLYQTPSVTMAANVRGGLPPPQCAVPRDLQQ